jgi:hypothetical protein
VRARPGAGPGFGGLARRSARPPGPPPGALRCLLLGGRGERVPLGGFAAQGAEALGPGLTLRGETAALGKGRARQGPPKGGM